MRQIKCENCGSISFVRVGKYLVCTFCRTVYIPDADELPESPNQEPGKSVAADPEDFVIKNGVLEKYIGKAPVVPIPSRVSKIGPEAFANTDVSYVGFPAKLTSIGKGAFRGCKNLKSVEFHKGLEELGDEAFMESGLTSLFFPEDFFFDLDHFGERVFKNCKSLQSVEFPDDVYEISAGTFQDCQNLKKVVWPNDLTDIGDDAFRNTGITSLILPDTISTIGDYAFAHTEISEVQLPSEVWSLGEGAFSDCKGLNTAVFNIVEETWLKAKIFENSEVGTVRLPATLDDVDSSAFHNARIGVLYLPKNVEFDEPFDSFFVQDLYLEDLYFTGESEWADWKDYHSEEDWEDIDWYDEEHENDYDLVPGKDRYDRPIVYWYLTRYVLKNVAGLRSIHFPASTDVPTLIHLLFPKKGLWTDRLNDIVLFVGENNLSSLVDVQLRVNRFLAPTPKKALRTGVPRDQNGKCLSFYRFVCEGRVLYRGQQVVVFSRSVNGLNNDDTWKHLMSLFPMFLRSEVSKAMREAMSLP